MYRRVFPIFLFISFLLLSSVLLANTKAAALTATPSPSPTSPASYSALPSSGAAPLTSQFTNTGSFGTSIQLCTWSFGDGAVQTFLASPGHTFSACPSVFHTYANPGSFTTSLNLVGGFSGIVVRPGQIFVSGATPTPAPTGVALPDLRVASINYLGSNPACDNNPRVTVTVINGGVGGADAGPFEVTYGSQTQSASGLAFSQQASFNFAMDPNGNHTATADSTNSVAELDETNNSWTAWIPAPTQAPNCTPTSVISPTPTPTRTLTPVAGICSPVDATISAPFSHDGAGTFCWQSNNLGGYINSWNLNSLMVNGVNFTNIYATSASYPAQVGGYWYVAYNAQSYWSHFEASGTGGPTNTPSVPTYTPTPTATPIIVVDGPDLIVESITYVGSTPACANAPKDNVVVKNIGFSTASTFVVSFNSQTQTVSGGLGAGQSVTLSFNAVSQATATADSTNVVPEVNETNNSLTVSLPIPTQAHTCTPTPGGPTFTPTPTRTATSTPTRTPTVIITITPSWTPSPTPTSGGTGTCSPVNATISAPFTKDGAGTFCWQSSNLGSYTNNWNMASLTINGVNFTNVYVGSGSYPAQIGGYWYVVYNGPYAWSHFEAK